MVTTLRLLQITETLCRAVEDARQDSQKMTLCRTNETAPLIATAEKSMSWEASRVAWENLEQLLLRHLECVYFDNVF